MLKPFIRIDPIFQHEGEARQWRVSSRYAKFELVTADPMEAVRSVMNLRKTHGKAMQFSTNSDVNYVELLEIAFAELDRKYTAQINALIND